VLDAATNSKHGGVTCHLVISRPATTTTWPHAGYSQWVNVPQQSTLIPGTCVSL